MNLLIELALLIQTPVMVVIALKTLQEMLKAVIVLDAVATLYMVVIVANPLIAQQLHIQKLHIKPAQLIVKQQIQMKPLIHFQNKKVNKWILI